MRCLPIEGGIARKQHLPKNSDDTMPDVKTCRNMEEVRAEIDRLDRSLIRMLAERAQYVAQAGQIKQHADQIRDDARIEDVVAKVRGEAEKVGLAPQVAEATWRAMIEAFIAFEAEIFDRNRDGNS
jgi:isochorismate pyruvate lyase